MVPEWFPCLALIIKRETLALSQIAENTISEGLIEDWLKCQILVNIVETNKNKQINGHVIHTGFDLLYRI